MPTPDPTDLDWLALCLVTESNRPDEWPAIAQVIENRRQHGQFGGHTYKQVVLAPHQFSAFNGLTGRGGVKPETLGPAAFIRLAGAENVLLLLHACVWANGAVRSQGPGVVGPIFPPITPATMHYYSPVSMRPVNSKPAWAASAKRLYTPSGIDPERFVFAEEVA